MEQNNNQSVTKENKKTSQYSAIRVNSQTQKKLNILLQKANKKSFGKRIKANDLLEVALTLLSDSHIKNLQENSLSNSDLLEMKFKEHIKRNGKISKDEYLGLLLKKSETTAA